MVSAPGKLILSGEWSVLEVDNPAIVAAINRRVYCEIQPSARLSIELEDFVIEAKAEFHQKSLEWTGALSPKQKHVLIFAQKAIECTINYLSQCNTFKLKTWSDLKKDKDQKMGFGTSAAAMVAMVGAILQFHNIEISTDQGKEIVFKLACIAHFQAQGNIGSGFDVAASTWGGIILYKRFDPVWLESELKKSITMSEIINQKWPKLQIQRLSRPPRLQLLVGWTGSPASTVNMIKQVSKHPKRILIFNQISELIKHLIPAWDANEEHAILALTRENESLLRNLGIATKVPIETPTLRRLADTANKMGAAGKLSGAGGGDCGIAIYFDPKITPTLKKAWQGLGIQIIDVQIDERGIE